MTGSSMTHKAENASLSQDLQQKTNLHHPLKSVKRFIFIQLEKGNKILKFRKNQNYKLKNKCQKIIYR